MPFKRSGRENYYFHPKTAAGEYPLRSTGTSHKATANEIERVWNDLADQRAWDVLGRVESGEYSFGELLDAYRGASGRLTEIRRRFQDVNLCELAQDYLAYYSSLGRRPDTEQHVRVALEWLFPNGHSRAISLASPAWLAEKLASYPATPSTRRKVRSEWNGFFKWLRDIRELIEANPLDRVKAPAQPRRPIEFYELDVVERIVGHQPTEDRRALLALLYGTGMEVSTALQLTRADFKPSTTGGSIHAKGTKAHNRDRIAYVDDWAWDILWPFAKLRIQGKLFGVQSRHTVSKWHSETCKALGLPDVYPLKNARHHWAATHLRAGYQIQFVQKQLGHATPKETLDVYGRFIPSEADHRRFQSVLVALDKERRSAMGGAK